jgi:hypothetical protein
MYADPGGTNWDENVNYVLWAYRAQPHDATGYAPYLLAHGREMKGPSDRELAAYERQHKGTPDMRGQVARLARRLQRARRIARANLRKGKSDQRARHDERAARVTYYPGQLVYRKQMVKGR